MPVVTGALVVPGPLVVNEVVPTAVVSSGPKVSTVSPSSVVISVVVEPVDMEVEMKPEEPVVVPDVKRSVVVISVVVGGIMVVSSPQTYTARRMR